MRSLKKKRWKKKKLNIILTIIVCAFGVLIGNYLRIGFAEENRNDYTLISGESFNIRLKNLINSTSDAAYSTSDSKLLNLTFDTFSEEKYGLVGSIEAFNWDDGINVESSNNGKIRLFYNPDTQTAYVLVKDSNKIYFNENCGNMFTNFTKLINIKFNSMIFTSKTKKMSYMFLKCLSLTELDLSSFNTSNVTDMYSMFSECSKLTTLKTSNFNTSNVTNMSHMFSKCSNLTTLDLSNFNTSNVTSINSMFYGCSKLTSLDLKNFDISKVKDLSWMFSGCKKITNLNLSSFDTSNVTNMMAMFFECSNLIKLDLSNFDTSKVTSISTIFYSCSNLTELDLSNFDTSQIKNMSYMFNGCSSITTLNLSSFNTSQVTDMSYMFYCCRNLETIYVSRYDATTNKGWNTSSITSSDGMFTNTPKLVGGNKTAFTESDIQYAVIDSPSQPGYLTEKITYTTNLNISYNINNNKDLVISFNPGVNYITNLYLMNGDNKIDLVENNDYSIVDGKLVLKESTLNSLEKVSYKLHIKNKGSLEENVIDLNITDQVENTNKGEVIDDSNAPKTGDAITRYVLLFVVSFISFVLLTIMLFTNKKKCKEELEII